MFQFVFTLLLLCVGYTPTAAVNVTLIQNRTVASSNCTKQTNLTMLRANTSSIDYSCRTQIFDNYANDTKQTVQKVARGTLNCTALNLDPAMENFTTVVQNNTYSAYKTSFETLHERYVWNGMLTNRGGQMSVVWDSVCNASIFQLDITLLASKNSSQIQITTRPCVNSTIDNCLWSVQLAVDTSRREEPPRTALPTANTTDVDMDLNDLNRNRFKRRLSGNRVQMHSGRILDDGSVIKILYLYSIASQNRYGDATIQSMIASAHASTNQAFADSGLNFRAQAVGIFSIQNNGYDMVGALSDLVNGNVRDVHLLRNIFHADVTQLIVEDTSYCGYSFMNTNPSANFESYAYNVVYSGCLNTYSSTHELGHLLAADHDYDDASKSSIFPYGFGNRLCNNGQTAPSNGNIPFWRSVMSYSCANSVRVPIFSGPNTYFQNSPTGNYQQQNNQYVLQQTHTIVANFRVG